MTRITFTSSSIFMEMLLELHERGIDCCGASDGTGFYHIDIKR